MQPNHTWQTVSTTAGGDSAYRSKLLRSSLPPNAIFYLRSPHLFLPVCYVCSSQLWICQVSLATLLPPTPITCTRVRARLFTTRFCHASTFTVFVQLLIYLGFLPSFLTGQREWQTSRNGSFNCSDSNAVSNFKFPNFYRRSLPPGSGYIEDVTAIREDFGAA